VSNLADLIDALRIDHMPVAAMERLIAHGPAGIPALSDAMRASVDADDWAPLWISVVLGELRDPAGAEPLAFLLRSPIAEYSGMAMAASESLARIGTAALPAVQRLILEENWRPRFWAYFAAGGIDDPAARELLLHALQHDAGLRHIAAERACRARPAQRRRADLSRARDGRTMAAPRLRRSDCAAAPRSGAPR
jgi:hypothetical protein